MRRYTDGPRATIRRLYCKTSRESLPFPIPLYSIYDPTQVEQLRKKDADNGHEIAMILEGKINRKVISHNPSQLTINY